MTTERNLMLPGNPRYQPRQLQPIFGYDNLYIPVGEVGIATMRTLAEIDLIPQGDIELLSDEVVKNILAITTSHVDEVERTITRHDIRAWVRIAQELLPEPLQRWLHMPNTSYDPLDTARAVQFTRAHREVIQPMARQLMLALADLVDEFADQVQIGRTHGQHAIPITVGFWLATILNRIYETYCHANRFAEQLVGKISGAVGAYNAQVALGIAERCGRKSFEYRVLEKLGLQAGAISTQIVQPEPLAYYLHSCVMMSAALAQLGRDGRNLMRTEIAEVMEAFEEGQVGSSTMAHKRNPPNFENTEGMFERSCAEYVKVFYSLLSDHQRDLVASSLYRDFPVMVVNLVYQFNTLLREDASGLPFISRVTVDREACERNLTMTKEVILAEPLYIALQMAGYTGDAHRLINDNAMTLVQGKSISLVEAMTELAELDGGLTEALGQIPPELRVLFLHPENYIGNAPTKAREIAERVRSSV
jgi:adenylosuccinate lyase